MVAGGRRLSRHGVLAIAGAQQNFDAAMQIVKALIEHGADVNATTRDGDTPLSLSKEARFPELAAYLANQGAR